VVDSRILREHFTYDEDGWRWIDETFGEKTTVLACTKCSWRDEDAEITLIEARAWEHLQTHPADDEETT
jgi:hypothetical protein